MSNYWGYGCRTCGADTWDNINHGDDILRDFATKVYPHLRAAIRVCGASEGWLEFGIMGHPEMFSFLCEHDGHEIHLHDEYNNYKALDIPLAEICHVSSET